MQGETTAETVRRLRLHRAAVELITGELPVARIARRARYGSQGDLRRLEIRGGRYAVTTHVGPYAELHVPYAWLYGAWLPQSGEEAADAPCIEAYLNDARVVPPPELRTEIWLPLR